MSSSNVATSELDSSDSIKINMNLGFRTCPRAPPVSAKTSDSPRNFSAILAAARKKIENEVGETPIGSFFYRGNQPPQWTIDDIRPFGATRSLDVFKRERCFVEKEGEGEEVDPMEVDTDLGQCGGS